MLMSFHHSNENDYKRIELETFKKRQADALAIADASLATANSALGNAQSAQVVAKDADTAAIIAFNQAIDDLTAALAGAKR